MKNPLLTRLENSVTYNDFKRLFTFRKNIDEFEKPVGLTLSDNSFLRYLSFAILYFAQGIPSGLLTFAVPAWMAMVDYSAMDIGKYLAIVTLPWTFKLIAAPIMDRFFLPSDGPEEALGDLRSNGSDHDTSGLIYRQSRTGSIDTDSAWLYG